MAGGIPRVRGRLSAARSIFPTTIRVTEDHGGALATDGIMLEAPQTALRRLRQRVHWFAEALLASMIEVMMSCIRSTSTAAGGCRFPS